MRIAVLTSLATDHDVETAVLAARQQHFYFTRQTVRMRARVGC
jgi:hypothetical protein